MIQTFITLCNYRLGYIIEKVRLYKDIPTLELDLNTKKFDLELYFKLLFEELDFSSSIEEESFFLFIKETSFLDKDLPDKMTRDNLKKMHSKHNSIFNFHEKLQDPREIKFNKIHEAILESSSLPEAALALLTHKNYLEDYIESGLNLTFIALKSIEASHMKKIYGASYNKEWHGSALSTVIKKYNTYRQSAKKTDRHAPLPGPSKKERQSRHSKATAKRQGTSAACEESFPPCKKTTTVSPQEDSPPPLVLASQVRKRELNPLPPQYHPPGSTMLNFFSPPPEGVSYEVAPLNLSSPLPEDDFSEGPLLNLSPLLPEDDFSEVALLNLPLFLPEDSPHQDNALSSPPLSP